MTARINVETAAREMVLAYRRQNEKREWERRFGDFYNAMEALRHYLKAEDRQEFLSSKRFPPTRNLNKHLTSDDQFLSILKEYGTIKHNAADDIFD